MRRHLGLLGVGCGYLCIIKHLLSATVGCGCLACDRGRHSVLGCHDLGDLSTTPAGYLRGRGWEQSKERCCTMPSCQVCCATAEHAHASCLQPVGGGITPSYTPCSQCLASYYYGGKACAQSITAAVAVLHATLAFARASLLCRPAWLAFRPLVVRDPTASQSCRGIPSVLLPPAACRVFFSNVEIEGLAFLQPCVRLCCAVLRAGC